jgi:ubiquitin-conjugating enzyme E2 W
MTTSSPWANIVRFAYIRIACIGWIFAIVAGSLCAEASASGVLLNKSVRVPIEWKRKQHPFVSSSSCSPVGAMLISKSFQAFTRSQGLSVRGGDSSSATRSVPPKKKKKLKRKKNSELKANGQELATKRGNDSSDALEDLLSPYLRNLLHSLLSGLQKYSPELATTFRAILRSIGSLLGLQLLSPEEEATVDKSTIAKSSDSQTESSANAKSERRTRKSNKPKKIHAASSSTSGIAQDHVAQSLKSTNPNYRIQRELKTFLQEPPPNLSVTVGKNIRVWIVTIQGAVNTIYEGETFRLRIQFPPQYPTVPPSVYFLPPHIPIHEHVYSNGDICLSLLGKDWRPTMTAQSIAVSILSILSSAQSKTIPMDNAQHAQNKPGQYQKDWVYHDDNC